MLYILLQCLIYVSTIYFSLTSPVSGGSAPVKLSLNLYTDIPQKQHLENATHFIFIDFKTTFGKDPHSRLNQEYNALQLEASIIDWITNFLSHRIHNVTISTICSLQKKC